jgi:hypothetical protein
MRHDYDIVEKFPDGSTLWRARVSGWHEAQRTMQKLAEDSKNGFHAIYIAENQLVVPRAKNVSRLHAGVAN